MKVAHFFMPKTKQQKIATVELLTEGLKSAKGAVFADFQGLTVADFEDLRQKCRGQGIGVLVAKKSLVKRALTALGITDIDPKVFSGGIAAFTGVSDEVTAAKTVNAFAKDHEVVKVHGGILEGRFIPVAQVKHLASLPGKQELLTKLVGSFHAPVSGLVNVMAGSLRNLIGVLNNIRSVKV